MRLRVGETYCKIGQQSVFMKTYPAYDRPVDEYSNLIIERSRTNYGIPARKEPKKLTAVTEEKAKQIEDIDPSQVF